jgi:capsule biosynthesis phosphatase
MPPRLIVDLDETITLHADNGYAQAEPNLPLIARLREYRAAGYEIAIHTSRNMRTYAGNVGKINANTLPVIVDWLKRHEVPFDEIFVGKPWCGEGGFYVDDKAIRPSELLRFSPEEIAGILRAEREGRPCC